MKQKFKAQVKVTLKDNVLDPQGKTILQSLHSLGFEGVKDVRFGKLISLILEGSSMKEAETHVNTMCQKLLANTVIEDFLIDIVPLD